MACLTRNLQKQLSKYIKRNVSDPIPAQSAEIRAKLVTLGICPSDVTVDQFAAIIENLDHYL